jgi:hypothetical protein
MGRFGGNLKRYDMKTMITNLSVFFLLTSCTSPKDKDGLVVLDAQGTKLYYYTIEGNNGDETKQKIEFSIDHVIVDSLKLSENKIKEMCEDAARYADWDVKYKPSYKQGDMAMLSYNLDENKIYAYMTGAAENAYGVADRLSTNIPFNLKGNMIMDADDLPEIVSY